MGTVFDRVLPIRNSIDYPAKMSDLVDTEYTYEIASIALHTGRSKRIIVVNRILPGGGIGVWFVVKYFDKKYEKDESTITSSLESALDLYNKIRVG